MSTNTTTILGLAVFVLAVFGSAWLNLRQIERVMDSLRGELKAELTFFRSEMKAEFKVVEQRITGVDQKVDSVDSRIGRIERQLDKAFNMTLK